MGETLPLEVAESSAAQFDPNDEMQFPALNGNGRSVNSIRVHFSEKPNSPLKTNPELKDKLYASVMEMHAAAVQKATDADSEDQSTVYPPDSKSEEKEIDQSTVYPPDSSSEEKEIDQSTVYPPDSSSEEKEIDQSTVYPPDSSSEEKEIGCISEEPCFVNGSDSAAEEKQIDVQLNCEAEKQIMESTDLPAEDPVPQEEEVPLQKEKVASPPSSESVKVVLEGTAASLPSTSTESFDELSSLSNEKSSPPDVCTTSDDGIATVPDLDLNASGWTKVTADGLLSMPPAAEQNHSTFVAPAVRTLHTFYMVRIPKPIDTKIKSEIKMAELNLKEMTGKRDFLNAALQMKRASKHEVVERLKAAREKERIIRETLREKRKETDPLHAALNKVKEAGRYAREKGQDLCTSEKELNDRIASMEKRMAHNSISLQEEKQLVKEIRQLNASREQVRANAPVHAEVQETLGQKDEIQARLKPLVVELDLLRKDQQTASSKIASIEEECQVLDEAISQLMKERDNANNARQESFVSLQILYKAENSRNDTFYQNRREIQLAKQHASQNDKKAVEEICNAQVEKVLSLWMGNAAFRAEYIKNNERSTLNRLETLDGRALGPDEEPPLLVSMNESVVPMLDNRMGSVLSEKAQLANTDILTEKVGAQKLANNELKAPPMVKSVNGKFPIQKASEPEHSSVVSAVDDNDIPALPASNSKSNTEDDKVKEELEAAQLKERRRQQEMAKAKEAEERKRRQAERTQAKALARAEKEAERREKEKEKRARKKAAFAVVAVAGSGDARVEEESITEAQGGKVEAFVDVASSPSEDKASSRRRKKHVPQRPKAFKAPLVNLSTKKSGWFFPIWLLIPAAVILILIASLLLYLRWS